jgi:uncharacterized membrane protein
MQHGVEKLICNAYVYACEPKDRQPVLHDLQAEERAVCARCWCWHSGTWTLPKILHIYHTGVKVGQVSNL